MTERALEAPGRLDVHPQERWPHVSESTLDLVRLWPTFTGDLFDYFDSILRKRLSQQSEHPDSQHHIHQAKAITSVKLGMKPKPPSQIRDNEITYNNTKSCLVFP